MKYFVAAVLVGCFVANIANSSVIPTDKNDMRRAESYVNYNFYAGFNCKKIEQQLEENFNKIEQLAEIKEEIRALKGNQTGKGW